MEAAVCTPKEMKQRLVLGPNSTLPGQCCLPGPRGLGVCELPAITSDTAHGMARDGKLEIIWPGPRRPLPGTVKPPQKINGGNFSIEEREGSPNLAICLMSDLDYPPRDSSWSLLTGAFISGKRATGQETLIFFTSLKQPLPCTVPGTCGYNEKNGSSHRSSAVSEPD